MKMNKLIFFSILASQVAAGASLAPAFTSQTVSVIDPVSVLKAVMLAGGSQFGGPVAVAGLNALFGFMFDDHSEDQLQGIADDLQKISAEISEINNGLNSIRVDLNQIKWNQAVVYLANLQTCNQLLISDLNAVKNSSNADEKRNAVALYKNHLSFYGPRILENWNSFLILVIPNSANPTADLFAAFDDLMLGTFVQEPVVRNYNPLVNSASDYLQLEEKYFNYITSLYAFIQDVMKTSNFFFVHYLYYEKGAQETADFLNAQPGGAFVNTVKGLYSLTPSFVAALKDLNEKKQPDYGLGRFTLSQAWIRAIMARNKYNINDGLRDVIAEFMAKNPANGIESLPENDTWYKKSNIENVIANLSGQQEGSIKIHRGDLKGLEKPLLKKDNLAIYPSPGGVPNLLLRDMIKTDATGKIIYADVSHDVTAGYASYFNSFTNSPALYRLGIISALGYHADLRSERYFRLYPLMKQGASEVTTTGDEVQMIRNPANGLRELYANADGKSQYKPISTFVDWYGKVGSYGNYFASQDGGKITSYYRDQGYAYYALLVSLKYPNIFSIESQNPALYFENGSYLDGSFGIHDMPVKVYSFDF